MLESAASNAAKKNPRNRRCVGSDLARHRSFDDVTIDDRKFSAREVAEAQRIHCEGQRKDSAMVNRVSSDLFENYK